MDASCYHHVMLRDRMNRTSCRAALPVALLVAAAGLAGTPDRTLAQEWDSPRALQLVEQARERRQEPLLDEALRNYRANVGGHVYFFVDSPEQADPILLRADQVALDLYWAYPDRVKQVIRGMRHEEQFPIRDFHYYLDRYTVIHDGFGDEIRVGEGRDVRNVPHPLAPGADAVYQYRLTDSTTIRLPGAPDPIRVYEVQVRPRSFEEPAIVGSLFIERARGDLVRLSFTFTRAAYLDPRNERVEVMLENALWEGRYWLPREQRLLVRRELPQFDFGVGTIIRAALQVRDYDLNIDLPRQFFVGPPVVIVAERERLAEYEFETGLYDGFEAVGLAPGQQPATLGEVDIDRIAGRILREQYLRGVPPVRFYMPSASHILRYDRTEGLVTGAATSFHVRASRLGVYGGYAWGSGDALAEITLRPAGPRTRIRPFGDAFLNRPAHVGLRPGAAGVISTVSAAFGTDYRDTYPASGVTAGIQAGGDATGTVRLALTGEAHREPAQAETTPPFSDLGFRPVIPAEAGHRFFLAAEYERRAPLGPLAVTVRPAAEAGLARFDQNGAFARLRLGLDMAWRASALNAGADLRATAAAAFGVTPPQHLWYLGGRNTLPGHPFHQYVGDRAAVVDVTAWHDVVPRLVRVRALAAAGWAGLDGPAPAPPWVAGLAPWEPGPTDGVRTSVGLGVGLVHGILRLDYAVRTDTGDGAFILSVDPRLWRFL
jgi:hypothetical protein